MQHPDEGLIHAWLDGALAADEAAQLESHVASCTSCGALVAEARGLVAASSRIVGHLDAVPGGVIPATRRKNFWLRSAWPSAIAATLIIGIGMYTTRQDSQVESVTFSPPPPVPVAAPATVANDQAVQPLVTRPTSRVAATAPAAVAADSVVMPPPAAALQKAQVATQTAPVRSARIQERSASPEVEMARRTASTELSSVAVTGASAAGAGARSAVAPSAPAVSRGAVVGRAVTMADQAASEASTSFAGCYEMNVSTDILPARFALVADSAGLGQFVVRYLDADGRPSERILDATWATEGGQAVIRTAGRGTVLTLVKTGSAVAATSPNGPRAGRVIKCGE